MLTAGIRTVASTAAFMLAAVTAPALAQYPERDITLIGPYGAGGGTDVTARMLVRDLEAALDAPPHRPRAGDAQEQEGRCAGGS